MNLLSAPKPSNYFTTWRTTCSTWLRSFTLSDSESRSLKKMQDELLHWMAIIISGVTFVASLLMVAAYWFGWL